MSLATLEKSHVNVSNVLAAATLAASDPQARTDDFVRQYEAEIEQVYKELRHKLRLETNDNSALAWDRITAALEKELDASAGEVEFDAAVERAGKLGLLSPSAYRVQFTPPFLALFRDEIGVRPAHVERCIKEPYDFQHLMTEGIADDQDALSLFMREVPAGNRVEPSWLVVPTVRQGIRQVPQAAWWIFPSLVDLSKARTPLDVLEAFAQTFGYTLQIGGQTTKFVRSVELEKDTPHHMGISPPAGPETFCSWSIRRDLKIDPKLFRLGCGYAIDVARYKAAIAPLR